MRRIWLFSPNKIKKALNLLVNVVFLSTDSKAGHKLFEPDITTNANVSNWASYCRRGTKKVKSNYCRNWIGIKWDSKDSKFKYESNDEILAWGNFKYPENHIANKTHHSCKYRRSSHLNCTQKNNCLRWLKSGLAKY